MNKSWHEYIDIIYYINLDHRTDRNEQFLEEMHKMQVPIEKIVRISAVNKPYQGALGCGFSHLNSIDMFQSSTHQNCIIFEDDFMFIQDFATINHQFQCLFNQHIPFDICMLSCQEVELDTTPFDFIHKVIHGHTTSGFILDKRFAPTLFDTFLQCVHLLEQSYEYGTKPEIQYHFNIDQYWCKIQPHNKWYVFFPKLGVQRESYSDIQREQVNYFI
jgi:GR25 family glycosyltransferase involved in LPS biosynthesis